MNVVATSRSARSAPTVLMGFWARSSCKSDGKDEKAPTGIDVMRFADKYRTCSDGRLAKIPSGRAVILLLNKFRIRSDVMPAKAPSGSVVIPFLFKNMAVTVVGMPHGTIPAFLQVTTVPSSTQFWL